MYNDAINFDENFEYTDIEGKAVNFYNIICRNIEGKYDSNFIPQRNVNKIEEDNDFISYNNNINNETENNIGTRNVEMTLETNFPEEYFLLLNNEGNFANIRNVHQSNQQEINSKRNIEQTQNLEFYNIRNVLINEKLENDEVRKVLQFNIINQDSLTNTVINIKTDENDKNTQRNVYFTITVNNETKRFIESNMIINSDCCYNNNVNIEYIDQTVLNILLSKYLKFDTYLYKQWNILSETKRINLPTLNIKTDLRHNTIVNRKTYSKLKYQQVRSLTRVLKNIRNVHKNIVKINDVCKVPNLKVHPVPFMIAV